MRRLLLLLIVASVLVLPVLEVRAADVADLEGESIALVNSERAQAGLAPVTSDPAALEVARRWSANMAEAGGLSHNQNLPNEIDGWLKLGENVGRGPSVGDIHKAFMDSDAHRHNILDPSFESLAVGIVQSNNQIWLTQVFILREKAATPAAATAKPAAAVTPKRVRVAGVKVTKPPVEAAPPAPTAVEGATFLEPQSQTAMMIDTEVSGEGEVLAIDGIDLGGKHSDIPMLAASLMLIAVVGAHMIRLSLQR